MLKKSMFVFFQIIILFGSCSNDYQSKSFHPLSTGEVIDGIYSINDGGISNVNMYIVRSSDGYIAVDAGCYKFGVKKELKKLNINPDEVKAVFLTHLDSDHVSSLPLFKNADIYIPEEEKKHFILENFRIYTIKPDYGYRTLKDGDLIYVNGISVFCISTPGHSLGSMSFIIDNHNLFVGDTMSIIDGEADTFIESYNVNTESQNSSIQRLSKLNNIKYIFTGHHGYSNDFNTLFKNYF